MFFAVYSPLPRPWIGGNRIMPNSGTTRTHRWTSAHSSMSESVTAKCHPASSAGTPRPAILSISDITIADIRDCC
jgi:D-hexose-6-phosphate mutarotase